VADPAADGAARSWTGAPTATGQESAEGIGDGQTRPAHRGGRPPAARLRRHSDHGRRL